MSTGPLIVQSDKTLLLEVDHPQAQDCRKAIAPFAELERPATTARTDASAAPFDLIARDLDPDLDLAIPAVDNPTTTN